MLHLDEVIAAEIYAGLVSFAGKHRRGKEVLKPWVSNGVSFGTFLSLMKEQYEHSRKSSLPPSKIFDFCHLPRHTRPQAGVRERNRTKCGSERGAEGGKALRAWDNKPS